MHLILLCRFVQSLLQFFLLSSQFFVYYTDHRFKSGLTLQLLYSALRAFSISGLFTSLLMLQIWFLTIGLGSKN